jgi:AraC family transcriptional regulator of adaptative response/methylated-DNA-[protein]-cysteine methyltransferase
MNLMTSRTVLHGSPVNGAVDTLSYAACECALGQVLVARSTKGVRAILIGADDDEVAADLAARFPQDKLVANAVAVHDDLTNVIRFVEKPCADLHLKLEIRGTPFQRRVWEKLRAIAVGRTVTYTELARWISPLVSPRVVASACVANPIALAIPCHRVVSHNGDLVGYYWGIERQRQLIANEARMKGMSSSATS